MLYDSKFIVLSFSSLGLKRWRSLGVPQAANGELHDRVSWRFARAERPGESGLKTATKGLQLDFDSGPTLTCRPKFLILA